MLCIGREEKILKLKDSKYKEKSSHPGLILIIQHALVNKIKHSMQIQTSFFLILEVNQSLHSGIFILLTK